MCINFVQDNILLLTLYINEILTSTRTLECHVHVLMFYIKHTDSPIRSVYASLPLSGFAILH